MEQALATGNEAQHLFLYEGAFWTSCFDCCGPRNLFFFSSSNTILCVPLTVAAAVCDYVPVVILMNLAVASLEK